MERQRVDLAETAEDEASTLSKGVAQTIRAVLRLRIQKTLKLRPALRKVLLLTYDQRVVLRHTDNQWMVYSRRIIAQYVSEEDCR